MTEISVTQTEAADDKTVFNVVVSEETGSTRHTVILPIEYWQKFSQKYPEPTDFIRASFKFLLNREPKESILKHFEVPIIARYFPEFDEQV